MLVAGAGLLPLASCGSSVETVTAPGQTRCDIDANAQTSSFPATGGTGTLRISTNRECTWAVQSDAAWLTLGTPASGQGAGSLQYSVAANPDPPGRTAVIRIEDRQLPIAQEGSPCEFRVSSTGESLDQDGGQRTVRVSTASEQCRWTSAADVAWITIASGQTGSGNGTVTFNVAATSGPERNGTLTIAGVPIAVRQSRGCRFAVDPSSTTLSASGGSEALSVATAAGCSWTAASTAEWVTLSTAAGSGPGTVRLSVAPWAGPARTATVRIADQSATVNQGSGCSVSFSPTTLNVEASGVQSAIQVGAMAGCPWSASSASSWISVTSGANGNGNGQVQVVVSPNPGPARSGAVVIAGQGLTVAQANGCAYAATPLTHAITSAVGKGTVLVSTNSACRWGASSPVAWITVQESSIVGTGVLTFDVAANPGPARTATLTVAGHAVTVNQAAR
jgi:hypothetical protein